MLTSSIVSADIIMTENFEDRTFNFTVSAPLFHDGAGDYYTVIPLPFYGNPLGSPAEAVTPYTGFSGSNFFAAEDVDDGGLRPEFRTMSFNVNIANYNTLAFSILFAASGNAAATPAYEGATNQLLRRDTNFDGIGDGFLPCAAFTALNNLAISGTGNNLLLEITLTSNDGNVEFAYDNP